MARWFFHCRRRTIQMNFTALQDRLRQELLRRIRRGSLSVSLLARQTGFGQPHISNFLRGRRKLSGDALDRVLEVQCINALDLFLEPARPIQRQAEEPTHIPVVPSATAIHDPRIRNASILSFFSAPPSVLKEVPWHTTQQRRTWQRFVAVAASDTDATAMKPLLQPNSLALIDRHYTSLSRYRPDRPNVYAVRTGARLAIRYLDFELGRIILRPHDVNQPVELIQLGPSESLLDVMVGRVVMIANEV